MKLSEIKPFYVVQLRNGDKRLIVEYKSTIYPTGTLYLYGPGNGFGQQLHDLYDNPDNLSRSSDPSLDVMKVWGFATEFKDILTTNTDHRELLWQRHNPDNDLVFDLPTYILAERETSHMTWLVECHGLTKDEMGKLGYTTIENWMTTRKKCKPLTIDQRVDLVKLFSK